MIFNPSDFELRCEWGELTALKPCSSGKELIAKGFARDVELSAAINSSTCVPSFSNNAYVKQKTICSFNSMSGNELGFNL